ncbi:unnamed protein product [Staurois parvus]|uniref:Uncharacterized protein n=1 Tax=Staurois parvus TaxID=386267 RepID=A0ABN9EMV7_9NEOB|nr:unnamed protein product [Staurois parvus]
MEYPPSGWYTAQRRSRLRMDGCLQPGMETPSPGSCGELQLSPGIGLCKSISPPRY